jgi:hypothetical protein
MSTWTYSASNEANLFKIKYGKLIEKQFNMSNVMLGRIKKKQDFVGKQIDIPVIQSIGGGVGAGTLPTANENKIGLAKLANPKKLYAVVSVDRETMKAAKTDEGSFVRMTKFPVKIATQSFNRNLTRQLLKGNLDGTDHGSGELLKWVTGNTATSVGKVYFDNADTYDLSQFEAIEIGDFIDMIDSDGSTVNNADIEVVDVVLIRDADGYAGTGSYVEFSAALGTAVANNDYLVMQNSNDVELEGIKGVVSATSGTYKNISIGRRWQAYQKSAASAAVSTDLLNDLIINVKRQSGESPDLILTSYHQYIKILNLLEDQKTYNLPARDKKYKGQISFAGVEFMSADGPIPVVADRFMDAGEIFALNTSHIELHSRPGGMEWFDEDGTVFLRESGDSYEARYGGYCELFVNPHFQGRLHTLAR